MNDDSVPSEESTPEFYRFLINGRNRTRVLLTAAALVLIAVVAGAFAARDVRIPTNDFMLVHTPVTAATDAAFRVAFLPIVERATAQARVLVAMGEDRERNLFLIRREQEVMLSRLAATDAWLAAHPPPAAFVPASEAYRDGASTIRAAMDEAQAGLLRFDFERVARATDTMNEGLSALDLAATRLRAADPATPSS